jgi:hypothetical protein
MVLVVSEKVRTSKWVHNEVSMAEEIGIPVIPVLAEKVRYPLWLRHLQVLDFCVTQDWAVLLGAMGYHVDGEKIPLIPSIVKGGAEDPIKPLFLDEKLHLGKSVGRLFSNREIQQQISDAARNLSSVELEKLCQEKESKAILGLGFPLFVKVPANSDQATKQAAIKWNKINRWTWRFKFEKEGYAYAICTQWYQRQDALVQKWLQLHGDDSVATLKKVEQQEYIFQKHSLSEQEKLWLIEIHRSKIEDQKVIKARLFGRLSSDFDPKRIDHRIYINGKITLIGLWYIDSSSPVFDAVDLVIRTIRNMILEQQGIEFIEVATIAIQAHLDEQVVSKALSEMSKLGRFFSAASGNSDTFMSIQLTDANAYDEYLRYKSLNDLLEQFYVHQGQFIQFHQNLAYSSQGNTEV